MRAFLFIVLVSLLGILFCDAWMQKSYSIPTRKQLPSTLLLHSSNIQLHMTYSVNNNIDIYSKDFNLIPALRHRIENKIGKVITKLSSTGGLFRSAHITLRGTSYPNTEHHSHISKKNSQIVEVTVRMKGGVVINASEKTDDIYASIDLVSHKLAQMLKKHNQKIKDHYKSAPRHEELSSFLFPEDQEIPTDLETNYDEGELIDGLDKKYLEYAAKQRIVKDPTVSKIDASRIRPKAFAMPPISVADAVVGLQFVDHPFYVFRNKETREINVVYKRENGGVGHIMPEK